MDHPFSLNHRSPIQELTFCFFSLLTSDYRVPVLLSNEISSHMIEKILHVVTPELWQEIYESYVDGHVPQLALHPIANFIVQHLMASATDKIQVGHLNSCPSKEKSLVQLLLRKIRFSLSEYAFSSFPGSLCHWLINRSFLLIINYCQ